MLRFLFLTLCLIASTSARQPNVVFFLVDDLGQRDLACYGSSFYETPNLDRLAKEGALFSDAYAACPVCSPSRAAIITGKYPQRTGITDYIGAADTPDKWKRNTPLLPAPFADRLALEEVTIAEALKSQGYATMFAGKWHLGPEGFWPEQQGFDVNKGGIDRGGPYGGKKYFSPYDNPRLPDGPDGEHLPDRLATEVCDFMASKKDQPFLAYFPFYSVHTPLMARPDLQKKYEEKHARLKLEPKFAEEGKSRVRTVQEHVVYAAMVEAMDQAVGKVLNKLDELGLRDDTIVIFTSDNGGLSTAEGWPTSNLPLRGGKGWMYEGGIRVPLVMRWPGVSKPGSVIDTPVSGIDFMPTLQAASGAPRAESDGTDLAPVMKGSSLPERPLFWHYPHYGNQGGSPSAAIRKGNWKLIEWFGTNHTELYDLSKDHGDQSNLAGSQPEQVAALRSELHAWQKEVGALFPTPNPTYDPTQPLEKKKGKQ